MLSTPSGISGTAISSQILPRSGVLPRPAGRVFERLTAAGYAEIPRQIAGAMTVNAPPAWHRRQWLVLALPIIELGPRASEDDPLAGDAPRADLAGVEVLDDIRRDQRREHEDADGRARVVADLVRTLLTARERDDVALAQLLLALVRAQRRLAAEDDRPFLVRVVGVKWPLLATRLDLVHARADQLGVGVRADPGVLEAPALTLFRAIPLVCVE